MERKLKESSIFLFVYHFHPIHPLGLPRASVYLETAHFSAHSYARRPRRLTPSGLLESRGDETTREDTPADSLSLEEG